MGRVGCLVLCFALTVSTSVYGDTAEPPPDPWFTAHVFVGKEGCLAVGEGKTIHEGDSIVVFGANRPAVPGRISDIVIADSVSFTDCFRGLRGYEGRFSIAHYETQYFDDQGFPLAIRPLAIQGLPASALSIGGDASELSQTEIVALGQSIRTVLPKEFSKGNLLRSGKRYGSDGTPELIEVYLGKPFYSRGEGKAPIDSIHICHVFLNKGRVLVSEQFGRASGVEEHVDLDPPQLDDKNWNDYSVETVGFLSMDGGKVWNWISVDTGFEGINWSINRLAGDMPSAWYSYLYTQH